MSIRPEIVDLKDCGIQQANCQLDVKKAVGKQFVGALERDGCLCIVNTGLPEKQVQDFNDVAKTFFDLPEEVKLKCIRSPTDYHGYAKIYQERFVKDGHEPHPMEDYRETFNIIPAMNQPVRRWPDEDLPEFRRAGMELIHGFHKLSYRCMELCALGLGLEDEHFFKQHHDYEKPNATTMRALHYPPKPKGIEIPPGTPRITPHADFDTMSFLIHDATDGFQVETQDGEWKLVEHVPGAILVICGHIMRYWTAGRIPAAKHRVVWLPDEKMQLQCRRSISVFVVAHDDAMIESIDKSSKQKPMRSLDLVDSYMKGIIDDPTKN